MEILASAALKFYRRVLVLTKKINLIVNLVVEDLWCEDENTESRTADSLERDDGLLNDLSEKT